MAAMEQFSVSQLLPRPAGTASQPAVQPRGRSETSPEAEAQAAMSFSHLLVESQNRPEPVAEASAQNGGAAEQAAVPTDSQAPATAAASGKVEMALSTPAGLTSVPALWPATGEEGGAVDSVPAPLVTTEAAAGNQGTPLPATAAPDKSIAANLSAAVPKPAAAPSLPTPVIESPAAQTAPGEVPLPAAAASVDGDGRLASVPAPASAVALDSAAKAQETYAKAPVVSESQLLADSLKQEGAVANARPGTNAVAATTSKQAAPIVPVSSGAPRQDLNLAAEAEHAAAPKAAAAAPAAADQLPAESEAAADPAATEDGAPEGVAVEKSPLNEAGAAAAKITSETSETTAAATPATDAAETTAEVVVNTAADPAAVRVQDAAAQKLTAGAAGQSGVSRQIHRQVISSFANRLTNITGGEQVTIKLNPESLGQIELNFEAREDRLSVVITATSTEADAAVRENLKDLTDRIVERSARFSHVDVRVEVRDGSEARPDSKSDQKQEGRQEQRRGQNGQDQPDGQDDQERQQGHQAHAAQQSWENAMSWQLADEAASEEG